MPSDVTPGMVKTALPGISGTFCSMWKKLLQFPRLLWMLVSYFFDEGGNISTRFMTDLCALGCVGGSGSGGGGGTINPNLSAPGKPIATDGAYSDHVNIQWPASIASGGLVLQSYKIYRSPNSNTNPNNATLIATVTAPTLTYDDYAVTTGVFYNFWIRAFSTTGQSSAFSLYDTGNASVPVGVLDDIVDLRAGFGLMDYWVQLDWTPPSGASKYDVYRHTSNSFSGATKIRSEISPDSTSSLDSSFDDFEFWDNDGKLLLLDKPPSDDIDYYYWVVAKGDSPPSLSSESNDAIGRVNPPAIYNLPHIVRLGKTETAMTYTVDFGGGDGPALWAVLIGSGGGGAGGDTHYGGGGGGGGGVVVEQFTVSDGDVISLVLTPDQVDTGNAASATNGGDGALAELQINGVTVFSSTGGSGGVWDGAGGGGGGGAGGAASGGAPEFLADGFAGGAGSGSAGGKSGYAFGQRRLARVTLASPAFTGDGDVAHPGSGASAFAANGTLAVGGKGQSGRAIFRFGS